jgi:hypothetical protein
MPDLWAIIGAVELIFQQEQVDYLRSQKSDSGAVGRVCQMDWHQLL